MGSLIHYNITIADVVGSAAFLLTGIALLLTSVAIAFSVWANYRTRRLEYENSRLELSYRLMLAASGGGDARLPDSKTHYSSTEVQTAAIAALRAYPEYIEVYKHLLLERKRNLAMKPDDRFLIALAQETEALVQEIEAKSKKIRKRTQKR